MTLKVIGAGFGRTATLSLKQALELLGFGPCYHMLEVFQNPLAPTSWERAARGEAMDWEEVFKGYSSTVDWPSCAFYEALSVRYPDAPVILSVRNPDKWFDSTQATIFNDIDERVKDQSNSWARMVKAIIVDKFDGRMHDRAHAIAVFNAHNAEVRRVIPKERLLVYDAGEGWGPLCAFLRLPVPDRPYPRTNTTEEFQNLVKARIP